MYCPNKQNSKCASAAIRNLYQKLLIFNRLAEIWINKRKYKFPKSELSRYVEDGNFDSYNVASTV